MLFHLRRAEQFRPQWQLVAVGRIGRGFFESSQCLECGKLGREDSGEIRQWRFLSGLRQRADPWETCSFQALRHTNRFK
jgi:hypothetical protein